MISCTGGWAVERYFFRCNVATINALLEMMMFYLRGQGVTNVAEYVRRFGCTQVDVSTPAHLWICASYSSTCWAYTPVNHLHALARNVDVRVFVLKN